MAFDIKIDPVTRDFVDDGAGGWLEVDDSSTAVICQLDSREGRWWGDPVAGSRVKEILESDLATPELIEDAVKRAMTALVQAKAISNLTIRTTAEDNARGYDELLIQWLDRASQKPADLAYSPLGGAPVVT